MTGPSHAIVRSSSGSSSCCGDGTRTTGQRLVGEQCSPASRGDSSSATSRDGDDGGSSCPLVTGTAATSFKQECTKFVYTGDWDPTPGSIGILASDSNAIGVAAAARRLRRRLRSSLDRPVSRCPDDTVLGGSSLVPSSVSGDRASSLVATTLANGFAGASSGVAATSRIGHPTTSIMPTSTTAAATTGPKSATTRATVSATTTTAATVKRRRTQQLGASAPRSLGMHVLAVLEDNESYRTPFRVQDLCAGSFYPLTVSLCTTSLKIARAANDPICATAVPGARVVSSSDRGPYRLWEIPVTADRTYDFATRVPTAGGVRRDDSSSSLVDRTFAEAQRRAVTRDLVRLIIEYKVVYLRNVPQCYHGILQDVWTRWTSAIAALTGMRASVEGSGDG